MCGRRAAGRAEAGVGVGVGVGAGVDADGTHRRRRAGHVVGRGAPRASVTLCTETRRDVIWTGHLYVPLLARQLSCAPLCV
jgi:hypothetical protein